MSFHRIVAFQKFFILFLQRIFNVPYTAFCFGQVSILFFKKYIKQINQYDQQNPERFITDGTRTAIHCLNLDCYGRDGKAINVAVLQKGAVLEYLETGTKIVPKSSPNPHRNAGALTVNEQIQLSTATIGRMGLLLKTLE